MIYIIILHFNESSTDTTVIRRGLIFLDKQTSMKFFLALFRLGRGPFEFGAWGPIPGTI